MNKRGPHFVCNDRGVTLLELVISLAMIGLLLPVIAGWLTSLTAAWQGTVERVEAREQALFIVRQVESEIREGRNFTLVQGGLYFSDPQGKWVRYSLSQNGLLLREQQGVGATVVGAQIVSCQFAVLYNGKSVRLQLVTKAGKRQEVVESVWTGRGSGS